MGYYYHFHSEEISIPAEKLPEAERLLRERDAAISDNGYGPEIDSTNDASALEQVAEYNSWHVAFDATGAGITSPYQSKKGNDGADWLSTLAPVIAEGGYAEISDDDGRIYRYVFHAGKCYKISPKWEIGPEDKPYE